MKFLVPAFEPRTLGEHLRKRRRELQLWQRQAALSLGVSLQTYRDWENDRAAPSAGSWKAVLAFLGYNPAPEPTSLAGHLRRRRLELGLAQTEAADRLGRAPETWQLWEADHARPSPAAWVQVIQFLGYDPNPEPKTPGERLRARRWALGLSQKQLAVQLGWSKERVRRYEQSLTAPSEAHSAQVEAFLRSIEPAEA